MVAYATLLKEHGLKATFQRINMLESIDKHGHMSTDAIYEEMIKQYPSLSLATVYKNIILMVEKGVLAEVPIAGRKSKYELAKEDHIHLVCTACGEVKDKPYNENADTLFTSMVENENFTLYKQQINLYGVCEKCEVKEAS